MSDHLKQLLGDLDSMEFMRPFVLLLLIVPVTIAFWEWVRKGQPLVMPFDRGEQRRGGILRVMVNLSQSRMDVNTAAELALNIVKGGEFFSGITPRTLGYMDKHESVAITDNHGCTQ
jgi:hypothetical protein